MPRKPSPAYKVSLYRLVAEEDTPLREYIQPKYLEMVDQDGAPRFAESDVFIESEPSFFIAGAIGNAPKWKEHTGSLVGRRPDVTNSTASAVLLVRVENYIYALCWGFGHIIIAPSTIDSGFGFRFAIRRADPRGEEVRSITTHTMDTLARTARTSVPGGANLGAFGMEEIGELVSRVVGRVSAAGLTASDSGAQSLITVRGADGLNVPLGRGPSELMSDLRLIHQVVEHEDPAEGLAHLEQTQPLRPGHAALDTLTNVRLPAALAPDSSLVALSWPAEWDEEHGEASSYHLMNLGRGEWAEDPETLELEHLILPVAARPPESRVAALKRIRVIGLDSNGDPLTRAIPGDKWITFETDLNGHHYVYHQGRWFDIGQAYRDMLGVRLDEIFSHRASLVFPKWPREVKDKGNLGPVVEGFYNEMVAGKDGQYLVLDKKLIRTEQHPRGIEACDLLGPDDELIHVKRLGDSVSASHLFNQAAVSAEALRRQADARLKFSERVKDISQGRISLPSNYRPSKVVLAFAGRKATAAELFTFSQVTLIRCAQRLDVVDVELEIAEIESSDEVVDPSSFA
jgi:uncharacterized protein (TIGR04141 family)